MIYFEILNGNGLFSQWTKFNCLLMCGIRPHTHNSKNGNNQKLLICGRKFYSNLFSFLSLPYKIHKIPNSPRELFVQKERSRTRYLISYREKKMTKRIIKPYSFLFELSFCRFSCLNIKKPKRLFMDMISKQKKRKILRP